MPSKLLITASPIHGLILLKRVYQSGPFVMPRCPLVLHILHPHEIDGLLWTVNGTFWCPFHGKAEHTANLTGS